MACDESCSGIPHCGQLTTYYVHSLPATSYSHAVAIKQYARSLPWRPFLMLSWSAVHIPLHLGTTTLHVYTAFYLFPSTNSPEEHYSPHRGNGAWLCSMYQPSRSPRSWNLVIVKVCAYGQPNFELMVEDMEPGSRIVDLGARNPGVHTLCASRYQRTPQIAAFYNYSRHPLVATSSFLADSLVHVPPCRAPMSCHCHSMYFRAGSAA